MFVSKFSASGSLLYSTYLGGGAPDSATGIKVDGSGQAYVVGHTDLVSAPTGARLYPTTANALQTSPKNSNFAGFLTELNAYGNGLVYSTFLSGNYQDMAEGVGLDSSNDIYVLSASSSNGMGGSFPITGNALQEATLCGTATAVSKFAPAGGSLLYSTYLCGNQGDQPAGIAVDAAGDAYVTG